MRILFLAGVFAAVQLLATVTVHACHHGASHSAAAGEQHCGCGRSNGQQASAFSASPADEDCCTIQQSRTEPNLGTRPIFQPDLGGTVAVIRNLAPRFGEQKRVEVSSVRSGRDRPIFARNCSYLL